MATTAIPAASLAPTPTPVTAPSLLPHPPRPTSALLDRDGLGEIPGAIRIAAPQRGDMVGQELQGQEVEHGREQLRDGRDGKHIPGNTGDLGVAALGDADDRCTPG